MNDQERELPPPTAELREAAEAVADAIHDLAHAGGSKDMVAMTLGYLVAIAGQSQPSEDWVQRQLRNPAVAQALLDEVVRLSCVEVAAEAKPAKWHDEHTAEDVAFRFEVTAFFDSIQQRIAVAHSTSSEKAVACANYLETLEGVAFPQVREMDAVSVAPAADPKKTDWERVQSGEPWNLPRVACEETLHAGHRAPAVEPNCGNCWTCLELLPKVEGAVFDSRFCRMVLCVTCGNKRCPKANNHRNECSNSNEPGQPGSAYEAAPVAEPPSPVAARQEECPHGIGLCTATCPSKKVAPSPVVGERDNYDVVQRALEFAVEEGIGGGPGWTNAGHAGNTFDVAMAAAERLKDSRDTLKSQLTTAQSALEQANAQLCTWQDTDVVKLELALREANALVKEVEAERDDWKRQTETRIPDTHRANRFGAILSRMHGATDCLEAHESTEEAGHCALSALTEANARAERLQRVADAALKYVVMCDPHVIDYSVGQELKAAVDELSDAPSQSPKLAGEPVEQQRAIPGTMWFYAESSDAESWQGPHYSLADALEAARSDYTGSLDSFWVDEAHPVDWGKALRRFVDADDMLERFGEYAGDNERIEDPEPEFKTSKVAAQDALEVWAVTHLSMRDYWQCIGKAQVYPTDPPATPEPVTGEKEVQACTECGGSGQGPDQLQGAGDVYQGKCGRCNGTGKEP